RRGSESVLRRSSVAASSSAMSLHAPQMAEGGMGSHDEDEDDQFLESTSSRLEVVDEPIDADDGGDGGIIDVDDASLDASSPYGVSVRSDMFPRFEKVVRDQQRSPVDAADIIDPPARSMVRRRSSVAQLAPAVAQAEPASAQLTRRGTTVHNAPVMRSFGCQVSLLPIVTQPSAVAAATHAPAVPARTRPSSHTRETQTPPQPQDAVAPPPLLHLRPAAGTPPTESLVETPTGSQASESLPWLPTATTVDPQRRVDSAQRRRMVPRPQSSDRPRSAIKLDEESAGALRAVPTTPTSKVLHHIAEEPHAHSSSTADKPYLTWDDIKKRVQVLQGGASHYVDFPTTAQLLGGTEQQKNELDLDNAIMYLFDSLPPHCRVAAGKYCLLAMFGCITEDVFVEYIFTHHYLPNRELFVAPRDDDLRRSFFHLRRTGGLLMKLRLPTATTVDPQRRVDSAQRRRMVPRPQSSDRPRSAIKLDEESAGALRAVPTTPTSKVLHPLAKEPHAHSSSTADKPYLTWDDIKKRVQVLQGGASHYVDFPTTAQLLGGEQQKNELDLDNAIMYLFDSLPPHCRVAAGKYCLLAMFGCITEDVFVEYIFTHHYLPNRELFVAPRDDDLRRSFFHLRRTGGLLMKLRLPIDDKSALSPYPLRGAHHNTTGGGGKPTSGSMPAKDHHAAARVDRAFEQPMKVPDVDHTQHKNILAGGRPFSANSFPAAVVVLPVEESTASQQQQHPVASDDMSGGGGLDRRPASVQGLPPGRMLTAPAAVREQFHVIGASFASSSAGGGNASRRPDEDEVPGGGGGGQGPKLPLPTVAVRVDEHRVPSASLRGGLPTDRSDIANGTIGATDALVVMSRVEQTTADLMSCGAELLDLHTTLASSGGDGVAPLPLSNSFTNTMGSRAPTPSSSSRPTMMEFNASDAIPRRGASAISEAARQKALARPTGQCRCKDSPLAAMITAPAAVREQFHVIGASFASSSAGGGNVSRGQDEDEVPGGGGGGQGPKLPLPTVAVRVDEHRVPSASLRGGLPTDRSDIANGTIGATDALVVMSRVEQTTADLMSCGAELLDLHTTLASSGGDGVAPLPLSNSFTNTMGSRAPTPSSSSRPTMMEFNASDAIPRRGASAISEAARQKALARPTKKLPILGRREVASAEVASGAREVLNLQVRPSSTTAHASQVMNQQLTEYIVNSSQSAARSGPPLSAARLAPLPRQSTTPSVGQSRPPTTNLKAPSTTVVSTSTSEDAVDTQVVVELPSVTRRK
ncbi:Hypothetical protein, putative, partial [Bodo saltans]